MLILGLCSLLFDVVNLTAVLVFCADTPTAVPADTIRNA